jgi:hypothetical protein
MRQFRTSGSVEGVLGDWHSYSDSRFLADISRHNARGRTVAMAGAIALGRIRTDPALLVCWCGAPSP